MKLKTCIYALFVCFFSTSFSFIRAVEICSWNLMNFGRSKSDREIDFIVNTIKDVDILLVQEIVADDPGGAQAVARLEKALNKTGYEWYYRISDATSGANSYKKERYAIFWKPSVVTLVGKPWLEKKFNLEIDKEPFYATFQCAKKKFTLVNFHAVTKKMQPEAEIKYFKYLPSQYKELNLVFFGDFNLPETHSVFNPLKSLGYKAALINEKTSLRQACNKGDCLSAPLDNCFYNSKTLHYESSRVIHFYKLFADFKQARNISDHVPIIVRFMCN